MLAHMCLQVTRLRCAGDLSHCHRWDEDPSELFSVSIGSAIARFSALQELAFNGAGLSLMGDQASEFVDCLRSATALTQLTL